MSNAPNNPFDAKGPWLYSGASQPTSGYPSPTPASAPPPASPAPSSAKAPSSTPSPATARPAAVPSKPQSPPPPDPDSLANVVDTIEAIIIALIIALTFRAYVVEAFVIPTGSMAPTLLGAHFKVICPACGYAFDRDAPLQYQAEPKVPTPASNTDWVIADRGVRAELANNTSIPADENLPWICPNCHFPITPDQLPQYLGKRRASDMRPDHGGATRDVAFAWANNGDRILVLKYIYSILEPQRWDVIVFKEPREAKDNYIKRLIALPNETVEIIDGDIYIAPPGQITPQNFLIQRKPEHLQKDLWQLVFDADYYPDDEGKVRLCSVVSNPLPAWHNPWEPVGVWTLGGPVARYSGPGPGALWFNVRPPYSLNVLGYNNDLLKPGPNTTPVPVGDLRLETVWTPDAASPSISLTLGKPLNLFRATWGPEGVRLEQHLNGGFQIVSSHSAAEVPPPVPGHAFHVALNNVDHAVQFYIDSRRVLDHETPWTAAQALAEPQRAEREVRPQIRIDVSGPSTLGHLRLFRDLYYTQSSDNPQDTNVPHTANEDHPLQLGPDEFFALGDNSRRSLDGRLWDKVYPALDDLGARPGIVPRRYLLGKAFFVYWPAGYRVVESSSAPWFNFPLIPDTGNMRMIR